MIIALRIGVPRAWHRRLADRLEAMGHSVVVELAHDLPLLKMNATVGHGVRSVLAVERWLYRSRSVLFEAARLPRAPIRGAPELAIALAGAPPTSLPCLNVWFDGAAGEAAMVQALLGGRAPTITIRHRDDVLAAGLPAVEDPLRLSRALDHVLSRLVTLLVKAVMAFEVGISPVAVPEGQPSRHASGATFLLHGFAGKLTRRLGPAKGRPDHWRIAYRLVTNRSAGEARAWLDQGFSTLPDDGQRFYADPFSFEEAGCRYIFFEDFPYASGKGVIGVVEIGNAGAASAPRTVLEAPVHLSYPFLMREGSEIYMLPEMSAARHVQLFRAAPFPDRWVADKILIDDIVASDATIVEHDGRYWMFATVSEGGDSTWDQLGLFYAPSLFGPWSAHPHNPVLIDAGAARPAGAMWYEGGVLMRVAQDCRTGYGGGLAICRVDRLDTAGFAQTVVQRLGPPDGFDAEGVHTLNRCGDLEVVDLRVPHAR